jgi:hypothetical protein
MSEHIPSVATQYEAHAVEPIRHPALSRAMRVAAQAVLALGVFNAAYAAEPPQAESSAPESMQFTQQTRELLNLLNSRLEGLSKGGAHINKSDFITGVQAYVRAYTADAHQRYDGLPVTDADSEALLPRLEAAHMLFADECRHYFPQLEEATFQEVAEFFGPNGAPSKADFRKLTPERLVSLAMAYSKDASEFTLPDLSDEDEEVFVEDLTMLASIMLHDSEVPRSAAFSRLPAEQQKHDFLSAHKFVSSDTGEPLYFKSVYTNQGGDCVIDVMNSGGGTWTFTRYKDFDGKTFKL